MLVQVIHQLNNIPLETFKTRFNDDSLSSHDYCNISLIINSTAPVSKAKGIKRWIARTNRNSSTLKVSPLGLQSKLLFNETLYENTP